MVDNYYPNVLIIGHYPGGFSGVSITLNNLFSQWPPEKLSVASSDPVNKMLSDRVSNYYHFGHKEVRIRFFSYFNKSKEASQIYNLNDNNLSAKLNFDPIKPKSPSIKHSLSVIKKLLEKTGLLFVLRKYCVSEDLLNWINNLKPDIILTMLGDLATMDFAIEIKKKLRIKLAVYILDDWVHANPANTLLPKLWSFIFNRKFKQVLEISNINIAICQKMADEYKCIYRKEFIYFHNPVDITLYKPQIKKDNNKFVISYLGKINRDTIEGLEDLVHALEMLENPNIMLYIYPGRVPNNLKKLVSNKKNIEIKQTVPHSNIQSIYSNSGLLFLPLGFSKRSRRYTRLSMPTKISEYMASSVPILLYAPPEIALSEYAIKNNFAIVVSERSSLKLKSVINDIYKGEINTDLITKNAYCLAKTNHNLEFVCENFRKALTSIFDV